MEKARLICTCALIEVAGVLVQKRWQNSTANHDVRDGIGSIRTISFAETFHSLTIIGGVCRLLRTGKHSYDNAVNRIRDLLKGYSEFQFRRQGFGVRIIDRIEVSISLPSYTPSE